MTKNWRTPEGQLIIAALVGVAVEWWMAHGYDALGPGMDAAASSISGWKQTGVSVTCSPNKPQLSWALPDSWLGRCASHLAPTEKWFASVYTRYLTYVLRYVHADATTMPHLLLLRHRDSRCHI